MYLITPESAVSLINGALRWSYRKIRSDDSGKSAGIGI
jgi:hypothetical protein